MTPEQWAEKCRVDLTEQTRGRVQPEAWLPIIAANFQAAIAEERDECAKTIELVHIPERFRQPDLKADMDQLGRSLINAIRARSYGPPTQSLSINRNSGRELLDNESERRAKPVLEADEHDWPIDRAVGLADGFETLTITKENGNYGKLLQAVKVELEDYLERNALKVMIPDEEPPPGKVLKWVDPE